jgi:hypothetical protein
LFQCRKKRLVAQWPAGLLVSAKEFDILLSQHPGKKGTPVRRKFEQGTDPHHDVIPAPCMGRRATPAIPGWRIDQARTHGVGFDITRRGQQMGLIENTRREPPLPEVPTPPFAEVDHARISPVDLSDRSPESVRRLGHGDEMDVIGHEAIRQNLDFKGAAPMCKKFEVALVILITEKGRLSSISTLSDVMGKTWCDNAS